VFSAQFIAILGLAAGLPSSLLGGVGPPTEKVGVPSPGPVTFSSHIAKIVHLRCAVCHHEGQSAPFNLLTYEDVRKRARQILEVVESGAMPPWLAEQGYGDFSNERRLIAGEKSLIRQWVSEGALEGDLRTAPSPPRWPSGWLEGTPDLVVTMAKPYHLSPAGPDVYRNFVIRLPLDRDRLIRAVEFVPGNPRIVHHAFVRVDEGGQARKIDGREPKPGFTKMLSKVRMPGGQFITWNPGSRPIVSPPGLAWRLPKNSDLVVEMHLNRTGKPETLQSSVGIYFADEQPTNSCYTFKLGSHALNFPAGAPNEIVRDSLVLPVDVDVLGVYPHAHFLGKEMQGYAIRPDGTKEWLIWIKQWNFNWQGDYRYRKPVHLPKGTTVHLQFSYDNSTNNPANPSHPPQRVVFGEQTSDEMCELGLQVLTRQTNDLSLLAQTVARHRSKMVEAGFRQRLALNPDDAEALTRLGMNLLAENRRAEAWDLLGRATEVRPDFPEAYYNKGVYLRIIRQPAQARKEFETALRLDARFPEAHQQLGFALAALGQLAEAQRSFEKALELEPADTEARDGLAELRQILQSHPRAD
jgi:Tfp pilus assembly protein PilF